jgi:hypothetical protein
MRMVTDMWLLLLEGRPDQKIDRYFHSDAPAAE